MILVWTQDLGSIVTMLAAASYHRNHRRCLGRLGGCVCVPPSYQTMNRKGLDEDELTECKKTLCPAALLLLAFATGPNQDRFCSDASWRLSQRDCS